MKPTSLIAGFCRSVPLFAGIVALPLAAQTAPEASKTEKVDPVVLSPFTVQTTTDVGYEASESLAGTGLRTKLTDLGAAVSVITSKFLEDTGSFNLRDVLVYQTNHCCPEHGLI
jgi:outer membrane receptor for ferric coprogen and ferric-rhodotorulic acid